jgi:uncharacterized protein YqeY
LIVEEAVKKRVESYGIFAGQQRRELVKLKNQLEAVARERLVKTLQGEEDLVFAAVEISLSAVIIYDSESCGKVVNKSNHPIQTPSTVTHITVTLLIVFPYKRSTCKNKLRIRSRGELL